MNLFADAAFPQILNVQESVFGTRKKAKINGVDYDALIGSQNYDPVIVAGGLADGGSFEVQVRAADMPAQPAQFSPIIVEGRTLKILSIRPENGIYIITAGDPPAET